MNNEWSAAERERPEPVNWGFDELAAFLTARASRHYAFRAELTPNGSGSTNMNRFFDLVRRPTGSREDVQQ